MHPPAFSKGKELFAKTRRKQTAFQQNNNPDARKESRGWLKTKLEFLDDDVKCHTALL